MPTPVSVFDVAAYILREAGPMSTMKLQKLVYYAQAWSLVWDENVLFKERICAWANGPVVPELFDSHRGMFRLESGSIKGSPDDLDKDQKETVDAVIRGYGNKTPQWLIDLTHREDPWIQARGDIPDGERGSTEITPESMLNYYSSL